MARFKSLMRGGKVQRHNATLKKLIGSQIAKHTKKQDLINIQATLVDMKYAI
jgi:hypothetical protein